MGKVLVKFKYDMNDADYIYGIHVMDKEEWNKVEQNWKDVGGLCVFDRDDCTTRSYKQIMKHTEVLDITDQEYDVLKKLDLIDFGKYLPEADKDEFDEDEFDDEEDEDE